MIPPLVNLFVTGDQPENRDLVKELAWLLRGNLREEIDKLVRSLPMVKQLPPLRESVLVPNEPDRGPLVTALNLVDPELLVPGVKSSPDAMGLRASLCLIHDHLDASHHLAQVADNLGPNTTAPYWHGIMHRREPDYDNARYWFRRVGKHAILPELGREVAEMLNDKAFAARLRFERVLDRRGHWDAMAFVDLCEQCGTRWDERAQAAAKLQSIEMRVLLEYTCRAAQGEL